MVINMKKVLSMILTVVMIASLFTVAIVPVSADTPAGTAITTAAEFAAMTADGTYYLANDITLDTTNPYYNGCFKGNFDGNGYSITLAGYPAFRSLDRTSGANNYIKNLTLKGTITNYIPYGDGDFSNAYNNADATKCYIGALAGPIKGGVYENITNEADIIITNTAVHAGGIYGINHWFNVTVKNCVNKGDIKVSGLAGGIAAYLENSDAANTVVTVSGCTNTGNIESTGSYAGGIAGNGGRFDRVNTGGVTINIENCINNGNVTTAAAAAAGIIGNANDCNKGVTLNITSCTNNGAIKSTAAWAAGILGRGRHVANVTKCVNTGDITSEATASNQYAGGIVGYVYNGEAGANLSVTKCVNMGKVSAVAMVSGIFGNIDHNSANFTITLSYNINAGSFGGAATNKNGIFNLGNNTGRNVIFTEGVPNYTDNNKNHKFILTENYYVEGVPASNLKNLMDGNYVTTGMTAVTADQIASGEVAIALNKLIGEPTFYQNVGIDKAPFTDPSHGLPVLPGTGDAAPVIILAVLAVLSVFGTAIVIKKLRVKA